MRDIVEKTIDGKEYTFCMFGAEQAVMVLTRLVKLIGAPAAKMITGIDKSTLDKELTDAIKDLNLSDAIIVLCDRLEEVAVLKTIKEFMSQVMYKAKGDEQGGTVSDIFDGHFQGIIGHMFKVFGTAVEVQYGDFFGAIGGLKGLAGKVIKQKQT